MHRKIFNSSPEGCRVMSVPWKGQPSILCSRDLSIGDLLSLVMQKKQEWKENDCMEESVDRINSYRAAKHLRHEVKAAAKEEHNRLKYLQVVPSKDNKKFEPSLEISHDCTLNRDGNNLYNHTAWMLTDASPELKCNGRVELNSKQHEQVFNLSQYICSAVCGIPTPKHVGTTLHVPKQTRSNETLTLLNRFGYNISYQDAHRYVTTIAETTDEQTQKDGFLTASNIKAGHFTQYAIDSLDFQENTKDGSTMHGTMHDIYQYPKPDELVHVNQHVLQLKNFTPKKVVSP